VVSLTTYGERLKTVYLALESIAAGSTLPSRLILWVDTPEALTDQYPELKRLAARGLEIRLTDNYGPHKKYFPYLLSTEVFNTPLATADDDILYSKWWLEGLVQAHHDYPDAVNCYRAHSIEMANGAVASYRDWKPCLATQPNLCYFATGASGRICPPRLLTTLKHAGSAFMEVCPKADDVWFHLHALRSGIKTRQVKSRPLRFPHVPNTQAIGLYHDNVFQGRNDEQIKHTFTADDIRLLASCNGFVSQCGRLG
jgi:hypothetical protein